MFTVRLLLLSLLLLVQGNFSFARTEDNSKIEGPCPKVTTVFGDPLPSNKCKTGYSLNLLHNDSVGGHSDKYMTHGKYLAYHVQQKKIAYSFQLSLRLFTPDTRKRFSKEETLQRPGRFGDQLAFDHSLVYAFGAANLGLQVGISHFGDHGLKTAQRKAHKWWGAHAHSLHYNHTPNGIRKRLATWMDIDLGSMNLPTLIKLSSSTGLALDYLMDEAWVDITAEFKTLPWLPYTKMRGVRQFGSEFMKKDRIQNLRWELAVGLNHGSWSPQILYISPINRDDNAGQIYIDLFAFYFEI